jgi:hypothetical protein
MAGETEKALHWLEKAYEEREPMIVSNRSNPGFDPLRSDPRFKELEKRAGLPD